MQEEEAESKGPKPKAKFSGVVFVERELCKGCSFCIEFCPTHTLAAETGFNLKGYHPPYVAAVEKCNGCNLCGLYCPDFAIFGIRERVG